MTELDVDTDLDGLVDVTVPGLLRLECGLRDLCAECNLSPLLLSRRGLFPDREGDTIRVSVDVHFGDDVIAGERIVPVCRQLLVAVAVRSSPHLLAQYVGLERVRRDVDLRGCELGRGLRDAFARGVLDRGSHLRR